MTVIQHSKVSSVIRHRGRVLGTSRCLVASSLRDMSISLVRMLRKCMSLRSVARFAVDSFVDWGRGEDKKYGMKAKLGRVELKAHCEQLKFKTCTVQSNQMVPLL